MADVLENVASTSAPVDRDADASISKSSSLTSEPQLDANDNSTQAAASMSITDEAIAPDMSQSVDDVLLMESGSSHAPKDVPTTVAADTIVDEKMSSDVIEEVTEADVPAESLTLNDNESVDSKDRAEVGVSTDSGALAVDNSHVDAVTDITIFANVQSVPSSAGDQQPDTVPTNIHTDGELSPSAELHDEVRSVSSRKSSSERRAITPRLKQGERFEGESAISTLVLAGGAGSDSGVAQEPTQDSEEHTIDMGMHLPSRKEEEQDGSPVVNGSRGPSRASADEHTDKQDDDVEQEEEQEQEEREGEEEAEEQQEEQQEEQEEEQEEEEREGEGEEQEEDTTNEQEEQEDQEAPQAEEEQSMEEAAKDEQQGHVEVQEAESVDPAGGDQAADNENEETEANQDRDEDVFDDFNEEEAVQDPDQYEAEDQFEEDEDESAAMKRFGTDAQRASAASLAISEAMPSNELSASLAAFREAVATQEQSIKNLFRLLDSDEHISVEQAPLALQHLADLLGFVPNIHGFSDAATCFSAFDTDSDGRLTYEQYLQASDKYLQEHQVQLLVKTTDETVLENDDASPSAVVGTDLRSESGTIETTDKQRTKRSLLSQVEKHIQKYEVMLNDAEDEADANTIRLLLNTLKKHSKGLNDGSLAVQERGRKSKCSPERVEKKKELNPLQRAAKNLKEVFSFYCKMQTMVGRNPTFEDISKTLETMNLGEFLKLSRDFDILPMILSKEQLMSIFKNTATNRREMDLSLFQKAMERVAEAYYPKRHENPRPTQVDSNGDSIPRFESPFLDAQMALLELDDAKVDSAQPAVQQSSVDSDDVPISTKLLALYEYMSLVDPYAFRKKMKGFSIPFGTADQYSKQNPNYWLSSGLLSPTKPKKPKFSPKADDTLESSMDDWNENEQSTDSPKQPIRVRASTIVNRAVERLSVKPEKLSNKTSPSRHNNNNNNNNNNKGARKASRSPVPRKASSPPPHGRDADQFAFEQPKVRTSRTQMSEEPGHALTRRSVDKLDELKLPIGRKSTTGSTNNKSSPLKVRVSGDKISKMADWSIDEETAVPAAPVYQKASTEAKKKEPASKGSNDHMNWHALNSMSMDDLTADLGADLGDFDEDEDLFQDVVKPTVKAKLNGSFDHGKQPLNGKQNSQFQSSPPKQNQDVIRRSQQQAVQDLLSGKDDDTDSDPFLQNSARSSKKSVSVEPTKLFQNSRSKDLPSKQGKGKKLLQQNSDKSSSDSIGSITTSRSHQNSPHQGSDPKRNRSVNDMADKPKKTAKQVPFTVEEENGSAQKSTKRTSKAVPQVGSAPFPVQAPAVASLGKNQPQAYPMAPMYNPMMMANGYTSSDASSAFPSNSTSPRVPNGSNGKGKQKKSMAAAAPAPASPPFDFNMMMLQAMQAMQAQAMQPAAASPTKRGKGSVAQPAPAMPMPMGMPMGMGGMPMGMGGMPIGMGGMPGPNQYMYGNPMMAPFPMMQQPQRNSQLVPQMLQRADMIQQTMDQKTKEKEQAHMARMMQRTDKQLRKY